MAKRLFTVLFVVLLMVCLAVFSYADESDFISYEDVTSIFSQRGFFKPYNFDYSVLRFLSSDDWAPIDKSYDYQFIFTVSLPSGSSFVDSPYLGSNYSGSSPKWVGDYSKSGNTYTVDFLSVDAPSSLYSSGAFVWATSGSSTSGSVSSFKVLRGTLKTEPEPHNIIVSSSSGGSASADVSSAVEGTTVNLTATPSAGYQFDRWEVVSGGVTISNNQFVMPDNEVVISAVFSPIQYSISVSSDGNGSVSSSVSTATAGTTVTLTATPSSNYVFSEWQVLQGDIDIVNNQFIMPGSNVSVKAIFVPDGTHSVTVENDGNGVGSANPVRAEQGTRITLSAVPVLGYEFDSWEVVSGSVNISNNQFIMPDSDVVVRAKFKPIVYTITLNQGSNGSATVSQTTGIIGDVITLTATPDDLYSFSHWDVTQGGITVENNQFVMPASDVVLTPVFIKQTAVSSGYKFNSGVHDDSDITARQGVADISFGELPAGEYLINIYSYGQNYGVSYDIGVGSDTTKGRKLPYTQSGGVTTALYTHSGGEMVLDLNFTYYKSVLNSPRSGSDVITGNWYEGTGSLTGVITSWVVSSSNWIFNIIDVTATPVGLANSEDYGIYAGIISFLRDKFDDLISVFGSEEAEEDVGQAQESLDKEVEELGQLSADLTEQSSNLEQQFNSDFAVPDEVTGSTSSIQAIYNFLFSSLGIFSIFIWLPVVLAVIRKLLRL